MFKIGDEVEFFDASEGGTSGPRNRGVKVTSYLPLVNKTGVVLEPNGSGIKLALTKVMINGTIHQVYPWRLRLSMLEANE